MTFTENEKATYLFCAQLSQTKTNPLTILEWNAVVKSLSNIKKEPKDLLDMTASDLIHTLTEATEAQKKRIMNKITARQQLGAAMLEIEKMQHQGYGILFRAQMPHKLKKLTQRFVPAFFNYAGNVNILNHRSLGVVGARNASQEELQQTSEIAKNAASQGVVIISGGARGVDTTAVDATLENGGKAIVFPADGLANWIKKKSIRQYIENNQLLLMSTQHINARFTGAYAMQRNKFIHAPSDAVLIASSSISGSKKSGTWEGVLENLKYQWSSLYVIGSSEGVEKLKVDGNAEVFSTFNDIYQQQQVGGNNDSVNLDKEIESIIEMARKKGLDLKVLENHFLNKLAQHKESDSEGFIVHEQLSLEDYYE